MGDRAKKASKLLVEQGHRAHKGVKRLQTKNLDPRVQKGVKFVDKQLGKGLKGAEKRMNKGKPLASPQNHHHHHQSKPRPPSGHPKPPPGYPKPPRGYSKPPKASRAVKKPPPGYPSGPPRREPPAYHGNSSRQAGGGRMGPKIRQKLAAKMKDPKFQAQVEKGAAKGNKLIRKQVAKQIAKHMGPRL